MKHLSKKEFKYPACATIRHKGLTSSMYKYFETTLDIQYVSQCFETHVCHPTCEHISKTNMGIQYVHNIWRQTNVGIQDMIIFWNKRLTSNTSNIFRKILLASTMWNKFRNTHFTYSISKGKSFGIQHVHNIPKIYFYVQSVQTVSTHKIGIQHAKQFRNKRVISNMWNTFRTNTQHPACTKRFEQVKQWHPIRGTRLGTTVWNPIFKQVSKMSQVVSNSFSKLFQRRLEHVLNIYVELCPNQCRTNLKHIWNTFHQKCQTTCS